MISQDVNTINIGSFIGTKGICISQCHFMSNCSYIFGSYQYFWIFSPLEPIINFEPEGPRNHRQSLWPIFMQTWIYMYIFQELSHTTVTIKCRTAIKALFLFFNLYPSVKLDSPSCSFTSTCKSFLTYFWNQKNNSCNMKQLRLSDLLFGTAPNNLSDIHALGVPLLINFTKQNKLKGRH